MDKKPETTKSENQSRGRKKKTNNDDNLDEIMKEIEEEYKKFCEKDIPLVSEYENLFELKDNYDFSDLKNSEVGKMVMSYLKIDSLISDNKKIGIPKKIKNKVNFVNELYKIVTILKMNDFDFAFFSLLLDKFEWDVLENKEELILEYIYFLGLYSLEKTSPQLVQNLKNEKYENWLKNKNIDDNIREEINIKMINDRKIELTLNDNVYCKDNFIDYNDIVDQIIGGIHNYDKKAKKIMSNKKCLKKKIKRNKNDVDAIE